MTAAGLHIPELQTERLSLRAPQRRDFDAFAAMLADPRTRYMGGPYDRPGAWSVFATGIASWHLDGFGTWIIVDAQDAFLGEVAIQHPAKFPEPELGWTLAAEAEGKGYAFEAAEAARAWYWNATEAASIVSYVDVENARSIALATRLGAQPDPDGPWAEGESADDTAVFRHRRPA